MKKTFKVAMLPTEKATSISKLNEEYTFYPKGYAPKELKLISYYHLYIISDDEIKEGDWCYFIKSDRFPKAHIDKITDDIEVKLFNKEKYNKLVKKIVATTDKSLIEESRLMRECFPLKLHLIPESFIQAYIKAYNEGKPIIEVDLECTLPENLPQDGDIYIPSKIKTRPDNTVIVHQSKMYSRDEVKKLLIKFAKAYVDEISPKEDWGWMSEWIQDNL